MSEIHRSARSDQVRDALVAAVRELIAEVGWGNVSTRRVAERAGVNPGLVHYHVASIEELRRAAAIRGVDAFFEGPVTQALHQASPRSALVALFEALTPADPRDPGLLPAPLLSGLDRLFAAPPE